MGACLQERLLGSSPPPRGLEVAPCKGWEAHENGADSPDRDRNSGTPILGISYWLDLSSYMPSVLALGGSLRSIFAEPDPIQRRLIHPMHYIGSGPLLQGPDTYHLNATVPKPFTGLCPS